MEGLASAVWALHRYGGGRYVYLLMGIAGYFVLTSRRIPPHRAGLYVALFFLSGMSYAIANVALMAGPGYSFLLSIFSTDFATSQIASPGGVSGGMVRLGGLGVLGEAVYGYLLARYGIRGLLDLTRPWRLGLFLMVFCAGLYGGFRSFAALFGLTFITLFWLEGLHRTRYLPILLGVMLVGGVSILPHANKLPLVAQRALSFLPGKFDPVAVQSAQATLEWRLTMWKQVLPDVPRYLFHGKGYGLDPTDLYLAGQSERRFAGEELSGTILAGDYHNGPLSVLIPFGIYGMIAFVWFLFAGTRALYQNYKFGNPAYRTVNVFLLASFLVHAFYFFVFFGGSARRH